MKSKIILAVSAVSLLTLAALGFAQKQEEPAEKQPALIAAYGTSYSPESSNAVSLLDPSSKGYWQPQSQDAGVNEGVYFQFSDPILINLIEVVVEGDVTKKLTLQPYLNGQTQTRKSETIITKIPVKVFEDKDKDIYGYREGGHYYYSRNGQLTHIYEDGIDSYHYYTREPAKVSVSEDENGNKQLFVEEESSEFYNITVAPKMENGDTVFTINENKANYLNYVTKSVFLKIKGSAILPKIKSIRIFGEDTNTPLAVNIPLTPKASVTASSVLNPATAYLPDNLFDSQLDMAWSTNGKETDGVNQSVTVTFDKKEEVGGIIIWNGYQRSDAHYKANGRVKKLDINGKIVQIDDTQGLQTILLPKKIKADKITLTIKEIFKSKKYKDVLISELRFITPEGQIILPQVKKAPVELSKSDAIKTDITYINLIDYAEGFGEVEIPSYKSSLDTLRIRSNGSFVLYREGGFESAGISEGNWQEMEKNKIRIFGKKYRITPSVTITSIYSFNRYSANTDDPDVKPVDVIIFQSDIALSKFNSLTKKEQENIIKFVFKEMSGQSSLWSVQLRAKTLKEFSAHNYFRSEENLREDEWQRRMEIAQTVMFEDLITSLEKINPVCIKSDVYTGLMIPYDEAY
ncbi:MAG: hypothetical protein LBR69_02085 [Endomicrobium sp.]|jgi:hypothetical protein|nr:hypothetical protein [Endomicrobium sp.]